jgi:hypothetical protein
MKPIGLCCCILIAALPLLLHQPADAQPSPPVSGLTVSDTPGDEGQSITIGWESSSIELILVMRAASPEGDYEILGEVLASDKAYTDMTAGDDVGYYYKLAYPTEAETLLVQNRKMEHPRTHHTDVRHGGIFHPNSQAGQRPLHKKDCRPQCHG